MKKVLILNGTISEVPLIRITQNMGFYTITTGNMPNLPGHSISDKYIPMDYSDYKSILNLVRNEEVDGIISCANDFGSITASYVGEEMGWKGHDGFETAKLIHEKDRFKKYLVSKNFPTPISKEFEDVKTAVDYCTDCEFPVIVKATDLTGGKGITKPKCDSEVFEAVSVAFERSRKNRIIVEEFIEGIQQSIVVFLINKRIRVLSCSNIYCDKNPYLVQAETYPATNFDLVKDKLIEIIHTMADDLSLVDGILSFQYLVRDGVPYIIDMMRRNFGNETLLMADVRTGFPWEEAYIKASLGMDCSGLNETLPTAKYCGHFGIMADENGILKRYDIPDHIKKHIFKETVNIHIGDTISDHLNEKISHIYFAYEGLSEMNSEVSRFNDEIIVEVDRGL